MIDSLTIVPTVRRSRLKVPALRTLLPVAVTMLVVLVGVLGPLVAPYPATQGRLADRMIPPSFFEGGGPAHLLGTDAFGMDIYSRLLHGAWVSLMVASLAIVVGGCIGIVVGLLAAFYGGWVDALLMRLTDIMLSMPTILIAIVVVAAFGPSFANVVLVIGFLLWPRYARQIRAEALVLKESEYVLAAKSMGASSLHIMLRHLIPNTAPTMLVLATLQVGNVIILESSLSFLGIGVPPPLPSWGNMVADGRGLLTTGLWISFFPGMCIVATVLSLNMLGDRIRDILDPKLRGL